ncbi:MAG TPA: hypothetical protein VIG82_08470 [Enteractinococcus sp.]
MVSPIKRAWSKKWMTIRAEYLEGKLPDFALHPAEEAPDQYYWECLECETVGQATLSWARAELAATGHVSSHVSAEDREILEDMKVTMMPPELLTIHQRARKRAIEERS